MSMPYSAAAGAPNQPQPSMPPAARPSKFASLTWTTFILGVVGVVGSPIIFLNNLTAVAAGVGIIFGLIALFGTKKILAGIGLVLCVLGVVFTVNAQQAAVDDFNRVFNVPAGTGTATTAPTLGIGATYHGSDVDVTIADPRAFTTNDTAMPKQRTKATSFQVTVVNHSRKPWSAAALSIQATAGSVTAEEVFDSAAKVGDFSTQDILPGKTFTYRVGFVDAPGELTIQVSTSDGDKAYFVQRQQ